MKTKNLIWPITAHGSLWHIVAKAALVYRRKSGQGVLKIKMASRVSPVVRQVKPILSINREDARRRVLKLYKAWIRQVPVIQLTHDIPKNEEDCKKKIREEFKRHAHLTDLRIIDRQIIRGQMELQEVAMVWKTKSGVMHYWKESWEKKPTDFMSKFLSGHD